MPDPALPILDELRAELKAAFVAHEGTSARWPRLHVPRRRALLPAGVLAVAAVAAVLAVTAGVDDGRVAPPSARAAQALDRVAAVAAQAPATVPTDDQFFYIHSHGTALSMFAGVDPTHQHAVQLVTTDSRIWLSIDRPGRVERRVMSSQPLTPADAGREQDPDAGLTPQPAMPAIHRYNLGADHLSRAQLLAYPTDPRTIYNRLLAAVGDAGNSPQGEVFTLIGDALRDLPAPAALRAGLYRALALIPGIEFVGHVTDSAGRSGTAVAFTEVGTRHELIFDPDTSELLAERDVLVDPQRAGIDAPAGTVTEDVVYLQRAVTDDLSAPPPGP